MSLPRGLSPARAEKTATLVEEAISCGAHPHVSGENPGFRTELSERKGSSPRERGKLPENFGAIVEAGLIPA